MKRLALNFKVDISGLEKNLQTMYVRAIKDESLKKDMKRAQIDEVEYNAKVRLIMQPAGDPSLTDSKNTGVVGKIQRLITSGVKTSPLRDALISWTGNIPYMDANDPILNLNPPRLLAHNKVRLWRILEAGTVKKHYLIPRIKLLSSGKMLSFYWKRIGQWVNRTSVVHPGVKGRNYFLKNNSFLASKQIVYESDKKIVPRIKKAFMGFMKRNE